MLKLVLQIVSTLVVNIGVVSLAMYVYFTQVLFYTPNSRELLIFNSIFSVIALIYILLYVSHQFLYMVNIEKLEKEEWARKEVEEDFSNFKRGLNPELLFESLETILVTMKSDPDKAEEVTDRFAMVYRYLLSQKKNELVPIEAELRVLEDLLPLFSELPYRRIRLGEMAVAETFIVPGSLLRIIEQIMRTTIPSETKELVIDIVASNDRIKLKYIHEEKIHKSLHLNELKSICEDYRFYTEQTIHVEHEETYKNIYLPKLQIA